MLNCSVIGLGVGEKHAEAYESYNKTLLKSLCDINKNLQPHLNTKFPNARFHLNDELIINDNDIDIISVASFDNFHSDQIIRSLNNGKHVMAEKPLCLHKEELIKIIEAKKNNPDTKLSSNLALRTNSRFLRMRNDIKKGLFGEVFYLEGDYYWGRKEKLFGWRADMEFYSIIHGAAIHMIDLAMWLLDDKPIKIQAMANSIPTKNTNLNFNSFVIILLEFQNGTIVKLTGNGGCVHPHFHGIKIFGNELTCIHNLQEAYYLDSADSNSSPVEILEPYPEKDSRKNLIHSFVNHILDDSNLPIVSEKDVYDVMSVCFAAEEAVKKGEKIDVNYYK